MCQLSTRWSIRKNGREGRLFTKYKIWRNEQTVEIVCASDRRKSLPSMSGMLLPLLMWRTVCKRVSTFCARCLLQSWSTTLRLERAPAMPVRPVLVLGELPRMLLHKVFLKINAFLHLLAENYRVEKGLPINSWGDDAYTIKQSLTIDTRSIAGWVHDSKHIDVRHIRSTRPLKAL